MNRTQTRYLVVGFDEGSDELTLEIPLKTDVDPKLAREYLALDDDDPLMDCYQIEGDALSYFSDLVGVDLGSMKGVRLFLEAQHPPENGSALPPIFEE